MSCDLSGTSLTNIKTVARQGTETAGLIRPHRIGATVSLTDFLHLKVINDLVSGAVTFNASVPLGYDGAPSITTNNQFATKKYADDLAIAGAPDASTVTKGIVEEATQAEVLAKTTAGATSARLFINPSTLASTLLSDYKVDTGIADAYVITPDPAIASYVTGQIFSFKAVNANTTASTVNVNGLGVKTIKKVGGGTDLVANDILAGQVVLVEYDGTNFQMLNAVGNAPVTDGKVLTNNLLLAGETLTAGNAVTYYDDLFQSFGIPATSSISIGYSATISRQALRIIPRTTITSSSIKISLSKGGSPTDNFTIEVQTDSVGLPSNTPISNGTSNNVTGGSLTTSHVLTTVSFASPFTLTAGTTYWIVFKRSTGDDSANYYNAGGIPLADVYASFIPKVYASGAWTTNGNEGISYFQIVLASGNPSITVWKTLATKAILVGFKGFVNTSASTGATVIVNEQGIDANQSGLINNADYFLSNTAGAIATTPGTISRKVGTGLLPTILAIDKRTTYKNGTTSVTPTNASVTTVTHNLGTIPSRIKISASAGIVANNSTVFNSSMSSGVRDASGQNSIFIGLPGGNNGGGVSANIIELTLTNGNTFTGNIGNITATTFEITWTSSGTLQTTYILWAVEF